MVTAPFSLRIAHLRHWQSNDPDIKQKIRDCQTEQIRIASCAISIILQGLPQRVKVRPALQSRHEQERDCPQADCNHTCYSDYAEDAFIPWNAENAAVEEDGADFDEAKGCDGEEHEGDMEL